VTTRQSTRRPWRLRRLRCSSRPLTDSDKQKKRIQRYRAEDRSDRPLDNPDAVRMRPSVLTSSVSPLVAGRRAHVAQRLRSPATRPLYTTNSPGMPPVFSTGLASIRAQGALRMDRRRRYYRSAAKSLAPCSVTRSERRGNFRWQPRAEGLAQLSMWSCSWSSRPWIRILSQTATRGW